MERNFETYSPKGKTLAEFFFRIKHMNTRKLLMIWISFPLFNARNNLSHLFVETRTMHEAKGLLSFKFFVLQRPFVENNKRS